MVINRTFRRDYWVKIQRNITKTEKVETLESLSFILLNHPSEITMSIDTHVGNANLHENVFNPIINALSDFVPKTLNEIVNICNSDMVSLQSALEAVMILMDKGDLALVQDEDDRQDCHIKTERINLYSLEGARRGSDLGVWPAHYRGSCSYQQDTATFLALYKDGIKDPQKMASAVWKIFQTEGTRVAKKDKALVTPEENVAELEAQANLFLQKKLPIVKALKIL